MSTIVSGEVLALLADLEKATNKVFEEHFAKSETLSHYGPWNFQVVTVDGVLAEFIEDGINLYPEAKS